MLANRSAPPATVTPELVYEDLEAAVEWLCRVFAFSIRWQAGDHRAQLRVGDGVVVVRDRPPDLDAGMTAPGACSAVLVRVEDLDARHARVLASGARVVREPSDQPYGERQFTAQDIAGHRWTFTQSIADVAPEEWGGVSVDLS